MKKFIVLLLSICLLIPTAACSVRPQEFVYKDLALTLDSSFRVLEETEKSASYASRKTMQTVTASFEEKESLSKKGYDPDMTLKEYGELCLLDILEEQAENENKKDTDPIEVPKTAVKEKDGIVYFIYTRDANDTPYTCLATLHVTEEAFWTVTFAAPEASYDAVEDDLFDMADEISFVKIKA